MDLGILLPKSQTRKLSFKGVCIVYSTSASQSVAVQNRLVVAMTSSAQGIIGQLLAI